MTFVEATLAPHARREEEVLYRVIGDILGQPRATEPMIHDHQIILETAHALGQTDAGDVQLTQELLTAVRADRGAFPKGGGSLPADPRLAPEGHAR